MVNPLFHTDFSISDSLKNVRKNVLIYETIIFEVLVNILVHPSIANNSEFLYIKTSLYDNKY